METEKSIMNVKQVCQYLGISESFLRKLIREDNVIYSRIKGRILFKKSEIDTWIEKNQFGNI